MVLEKKERTGFLFLVIFDILINLADLVFLAGLVLVVQFYIQPLNPILSGFLPSFLSDPHSPLLILVFFGLFLIKNVLAVVLSGKQSSFYRDVTVRLSSNNLSHYQSMSFQDFLDSESAVQVRKVNFISVEYCQYLLSGIQQIATQVVMVFTSVVFLLMVNASLFLVLLLALLPPVILSFFILRNHLSRHREQTHRYQDLSLRALLDAHNAYMETNIYHAHEFFLSRYIRYRSRFAKNLFQMLRIQMLPVRFIESFAILGLLVLVLISTGSESRSENLMLTIGAFMAAAYKMIPGCVKILNLSAQVKAYAKILKELKPPVINVNKIQFSLEEMEVSNIGFQRKGKTIFQNLSFKLNKGSFTGICGRSGSGKTTLMHILSGFLAPSKGAVWVNGKKISSEEMHTIRKDIAYVKQQAFLFEDSVDVNICFDENLSNPDVLSEAKRCAGLDDYNFAVGAGEMISEHGNNISGGEQQRIALARAFYKEARMIILDEPFNELDEATEDALLERLQKMAEEGKIIILVTHNKASLRFCHQIINLDEKGKDVVADHARLSGFGVR
jgi:ABC-type bacteriocin/lantibiotic exporter with double-glycine peptidase domain